MITAAGAGAAAFCVPPSRLKPARPPRTLPVLQPLQPGPPRTSPLPTNIPPSQAIETLLSRRTASGPDSPSKPVSLVQAQDDRRNDDPTNDGDDWRHCFSDGEELTETRPKTSCSTRKRAETVTATAYPGHRESYTARGSLDERDSSPSDKRRSRKLQRPRPAAQPSLIRRNFSLGLQLKGAAALAAPSVSAYGLGIASRLDSSNLAGSSRMERPSSRSSGWRDKMCSSSGSSSARVHSINVAVVGGAGVGKSTFIQKAYDLKRPPLRGEAVAIDMMVERTAWNVRLVELDWAKLDFDRQPLRWPRAADGQGLPFVDGVLVLYDVTNPASIAKLPESLDAFSRASLPVVIVSCKIDSSMRQLNPESIEQIGTVGGFEQIQTSALRAESQKQCVAAILSKIRQRNYEKSPRHLHARRRANSNSRASSPRPPTGHSRAGSELSSTFFKETADADASHVHAGARPPQLPSPPVLASHSARPPLRPAVGQPGTDAAHALAPSATPPAPHSLPRISPTPPVLEIVSTSPFSMQTRNGEYSSQTSLPISQASSSRGPRDSYVDTDDEADPSMNPDDIPILDREGELEDFDDEDEKPVPNKGYTWDELVDRLLGQPMSRGDLNFAVMFLCFYRKFAPPRDLLNTIMERFERTNTEYPVFLQRTAAQIRYCNILLQWLVTHPGDFAYPKTRRRLVVFLNSVSRNRSLAVLVGEMKKQLAVEVEDEDYLWARADQDTEKRNSVESFLSDGCEGHEIDISLVAKGDYCLRVEPRSPTRLEVPRGDSRFEPRPEADSASRRPSETARSFDSVSTSGSSQGYSMLHRETTNTTYSGTEPRIPKPLLNGQGSPYDLFMSIPVDEIAAELTHLDWNDFVEIRPRDLIRHISIPPDQRERSRSLMHVNRVISHFNHVAYWVASVILERPKPKHRARVLEKFMEVAWNLRHKNNYNGLGAVIAGINGTAVHRLSMTRELVKPDVHKKFMQLELLMGTHKSHSKYRLAWDNTSGERIPFLPLHRRDLVSADEGNRTFLPDSGKINWNKFQVMGEVLIILVRAQTMPYKDLKGNSIVAKWIEDSVLQMNDDELYERSVSLENAGTMNRPSKARNWFNR